ncbi:MAG: chlorophyll synthesis pathway protein BchC [Pseudomonadota bacterium]
MDTVAVVMREPGAVALSRLGLPELDKGELIVRVDWSGISTGTERLLWDGTMPSFPGMGYPLVPGYETVGRVIQAAPGLESRLGEFVFVSGAHCYGDIRGLFGGAASHIVCKSAKAHVIPERLGPDGTLMALAATAHHALCVGADAPELVVGHGVLGRLLARVTIAAGYPAPVVWEVNETRRAGAAGYEVLHPDEDPSHDYRQICDVSGDAGVLDSLVERLAPGGEVTLAGFYSQALNFSFAPAFMREARFVIAAEWQPEDLSEVIALCASMKLDLGQLISHSVAADDAHSAYNTAFGDPECLKMILDWRDLP